MNKVGITLSLVLSALIFNPAVAKPISSTTNGYYTDWKLYNSFGVPTVSCSYKRQYILKNGTVAKTETMTTSSTLIRTGGLSGYRIGCLPTIVSK